MFHGGSAGLFWCLKLSAIAGYPVAAILGVPLYLLYNRYNKTGLVIYIITGLILGIIPYVAATLPGLLAVVFGGRHVNDMSSILYYSSGMWLYLPVSALCGALAAVAFWLIARPDRAFSGTTR
jgi:hypothetical protein